MAAISSMIQFLLLRSYLEGYNPRLRPLHHASVHGMLRQFAGATRLFLFPNEREAKFVYRSPRLGE